MRTLAIVTAALFAAAPVSAVAQDKTGFDFAAMSDRQLWAVAEENKAEMLDRSCELGLPLVSELLRRSANERLEHPLLLLRVYCADERGEYAEAARHLAEMERRFGPDGLVGLGFYFSRRLDDPDMALKWLNVLVDLDDVDTASVLEADQLFALTRLVTRHGREDELQGLAARVFESSVFPHFADDIQSGLAYRALKEAVRRGDRSLARRLLRHVRRPDSYPALLAELVYEPIWPEIEERAGPNLALVSEEYREWALGRFAEAPGDRDRFSEAAHALHFDGRFEEAVQLVSDWRTRDGAFERIEEGDAWAVNIEAYALDSLGREAEADALFDRLAELPADGYSWVVNFVINRASRLAGFERHAEALEAADLAGAVAEVHGSTYARMLVARDRACSLAGLGRAAEAGEALTYLRENKADAIGAAAKGLLCLDLRGEAIEVLVEGLRDAKTRGTAIDALKPGEFELFYARSKLPPLRDLLAADNDLRTEYERWVRSIPDEFIPRATLLREAASAR